MAKKAARRRPGQAKQKAKGRPKARRSAPRRRTTRARPRGGKASRAKSRPRRAAARTGGSARRAASKRTAVEAPARKPHLERERRRLMDDEPTPGPPSSLNVDRHASAAASGRRELIDSLHEHTETSPALTGGDVDADWREAYAVGDETPGGDNPTPDQDRVDDIGRALGVEYEDNEELKGANKISKRDRNRWELDPASAEDYKDRDSE